MKFSANQQDVQKSLNYCQGVIEKRSFYFTNIIKRIVRCIETLV